MGLDCALALSFLFSCHSFFLCSSDSSWLSSEFAFSQTLHFPDFPPHLFSLVLFVRVGPLCACVSLGWTQGLTHWARPALLFPPALSLPTISLHLCLHSHGQTLAWLCIKPHCLYQLDRPRAEKLRTKPKETKPKLVRKDRGSHIIVCCRPFKAG